jgi:Ca2+-binding protein (EF-Hand superfamily)
LFREQIQSCSENKLNNFVYKKRVNLSELSYPKLSLFFTVLRKAFDAFDRERSGSIPCDMVADILRLMGQPFNKKILDELIEEVDADSK